MKRLLFLAVPAALLTLAGCDGSPTEGRAAVASVNVAPDERTLGVGQALQLEVVIRDTRGESPTDAQVAWTSETPAVATVNANGLVSAAAVGTAVVRATVEGKSGTVTVTVAAQPAECGQAGAVRSLGVGEAFTVGGISASLLCLDGGAAGKEYVMVPFHAGSTSAAQLTLQLATTGTVPVAAASPDRAPARFAAG
ncbi:MAG TPA: Ig-like domain-containing protein, partial [Longimicrobium sp.]|nr:Ig-like domain-containing protein [Longimicrobium sp.]